MGIILDIILLIIALVCIIYGAKKGFFKSVMALATNVLALLLAYTFTPALSQWFYDGFVLSNVGGGIAKTFASIAKTGSEMQSSDVYDLSLLLESQQFIHTAEQCGADMTSVEAVIGEGGSGFDAVERVAYTVASPISMAVSEIMAFILIFVVALILLKVVVWAVGLVFKLPVLRDLDKALGLVFGIVTALLSVTVFAVLTESVVDILSTLYPGNFSYSIIESSFAFELLAKYNVLTAISAIIG